MIAKQVEAVVQAGTQGSATTGFGRCTNGNQPRPFGHTTLEDTLTKTQAIWNSLNLYLLIVQTKWRRLGTCGQAGDPTHNSIKVGAQIKQSAAGKTGVPIKLPPILYPQHTCIAFPTKHDTSTFTKLSV